MAKTPPTKGVNPFSPSFQSGVNASPQKAAPFASPQQAAPFALPKPPSSKASALSQQQNGSIQRGDSGGLHYVSEQERRAFVEFMNSNQKLSQDPDLSHLFPIDPNSDALFQAVSDGALFW